MVEELKARIEDIEKVESQLEQKRAILERKSAVKDIYFNKSGRSVKKIRRDDRGNWLVRYEPKEDGFEKVQEDRIENLEEKREELQDQLGIETVQRKNVNLYTWGDYELLLIDIKGYGNFLVVQGENVSKDVFTKLGVEVEEFVEVPFSQIER